MNEFQLMDGCVVTAANIIFMDYGQNVFTLGMYTVKH